MADDRVVPATDIGKKFASTGSEVSKELVDTDKFLDKKIDEGQAWSKDVADGIRNRDGAGAAIVDPATDDGIGKEDDMVATSKTKTLTLAEQKALAAYAQYSLPKFYIPPLLVSNTGDAKDVGTGKRVGFIFTSIGDLKVEDSTFPRNLPILKVPDADIDAVQDMGFGSGNIKVSGRLWAEAGYARLQTLRELCKSRRPLIFISQETGPWYVMPQNVPGINTAADKPYQYFFDVTFVCVAQLNSEDPTVQHYAKLRRELVRKKFNREMAVIRAQNSIKNSVKNFDTITGAGSGVQKGFYYDPNTGNASFNPDLQELQNENFASRTTGAGGIENTSTKKEVATAVDNLPTSDDLNNKAGKIITDRNESAKKVETQSSKVPADNAGMPNNVNPGGGGRNELSTKESSTNDVPARRVKVTPEEKARILREYDKKQKDFKDTTAVLKDRDYTPTTTTVKRFGKDEREWVTIPGDLGE